MGSRAGGCAGPLARAARVGGQGLFEHGQDLSSVLPDVLPVLTGPVHHWGEC